MKQKLLVVILCFLLIFLLGECFLPSDEVPTSQHTESISDEIVTTESKESTAPIKEEKLEFELVAGKQGEYGKMITFNKGTEFEESFYAYYVPAGIYTVTNIGKYMSQISVYSHERHITEEGWEEPAAVGSVILLDVGKTGTITVEDGQYIEIVEPSKFKLERQ